MSVEHFNPHAISLSPGSCEPRKVPLSTSAWRRSAVRTRGFALTAVLFAALSGCGGGSGGAGTPMILPTPTPAPTPAAPDAAAPDAPGTPDTPATALVNRTLVIDLDGATYAAVQAGIAGGTLPNLAKLEVRLAYSGGVAGAASQQPTLDAPGWATLLTGTWVSRHQVMSQAPKQVLRGATVFQMAKGKNAGPTGAAVASVGLAQLLSSDFNSGYLDALTDCSSDGAATDCVTTKAGQFIGGDYATVLAQYRASKDAALDFGLGSPQYAGTLAKLDKAVGTLVAATAARPNTRWLVVVTGNHGLSANSQDDGLPLVPESTTFVGLNQPANIGAQGVGAAMPATLGELYANASLADVAPTVAGYLDALPDANAYNLDGGRLVGAQPVSRLTAAVTNNSSSTVGVALNWTAPPTGAITVLRDGQVIASQLPAGTASYTDNQLSQVLSARGTYQMSYTVQAGEGEGAASRAILSPQLSYVPPVPLAATLKNGLALYYPFSATLPPVDAMGHSTLGPVVPGLPAQAGVVVPGPFENAYGLLVDDSKVTTDGYEGYRLIPQPAYDVTAGATPQFTIGFWFKTPTCVPSSNGIIMGNKNYYTGANAGVGIGLFPGASAGMCAVAFNIGSGGVRADGPTSPYTPITNNRWVYIAFSVDGVAKTMNMYVYDPVTDVINRVAQGKSTASVDLSKLSAYPHWGIGDDGTGTYLMNKCNGSVKPPYTAGQCTVAATSDHYFSDLAMWNRVLTDSEMTSIFQSHKPLSTLSLN